MKIYHKNKSIKIPVKSVSFFGKFSGLMLKTKNTENLLFEFKKDAKLKIHSFFVFFTFLAVWLDEKNSFVDLRIVKPFSFAVSPKEPFRKLIEIPFNNKNKKILRFLVDKKI